MKMINDQLIGRGIKDENVLNAMEKIPRERFVPQSEKNMSYYDGPLPIGCGQTISQPYIVAYMTEIIEPKKSDRVLEIGTGSGYQTSVLAEIVYEVWTVECIEELSSGAKELLESVLGYTNINFKTNDGKLGWGEHAPFDKILITAASPKHPDGVLSQLAEGGIACAPVGSSYQTLYKYSKRNGKIEREHLFAVSFVPLI